MTLSCLKGMLFLRPYSTAYLCAIVFVAAAGCTKSAAPASRTITVAAASNLTGVMDEFAGLFEKQSKIKVVLSYGSTAQLAQQIANGAPFDLFAAADTDHVDDLISAGKLRRVSRAVYARGQLALWVPDTNLSVNRLEDLLRPEVRIIAVAQPRLAPYGQAALEALKRSQVWDRVQPKIVYANNISVARQYAASGNANAAFTALSLIRRAAGTVIKVDPSLYRPIDQALGIASDTAHHEAAQRFRTFLLGPEGRRVLKNNGYQVP